MSWRPNSWRDALLAELPAAEQARKWSYFHPALRLFVGQTDHGEWERIGITADSLPLPEGMEIGLRVAELFPEIVPSDPRMILQVRKTSRQGHTQARCPGCRLWVAAFSMLDLRTYPVTGERPVLSSHEREYLLGPERTVIDNARTGRDVFGQVVGEEFTRLDRATHSRRKILGFQPVELLPVIQDDPEVRAGFLCGTCVTEWIRHGWKVGGAVYTKLEDLTRLGAPQDVIDANKDRPGWDTPGLQNY